MISNVGLRDATRGSLFAATLDAPLGREDAGRRVTAAGAAA